MVGALGRNLTSKAVLTPTIIAMTVCFYGCMAWTIYVSFTRSGMLPNYDLVGLAQYDRLWGDNRWHVSFANMFIFGVLFITGALALGTLLAVLIDTKVRMEGAFRTIFLYPLSMSFIVTGLAWRWFLDPTDGLQSFVRSLGWETFEFDWLVDRDMAIYTIVIAAIWQGSGLIMAIMLAGLRSIDRDVWKATKMDGIPTWRAYVSVILPQLQPLVITCVVLLAITVVKSFDLVVALTNGGPGFSSDLPAKFVVDAAFERANIGQASAAAVMMLMAVIAALAPYFYLVRRRS